MGVRDGHLFNFTDCNCGDTDFPVKSNIKTVKPGRTCLFIQFGRPHTGAFLAASVYKQIIFNYKRTFCDDLVKAYGCRKTGMCHGKTKFGCKGMDKTQP